MRRLLPLAGMVTIIWLSLLFGSATIPGLLFAATPILPDPLLRNLAGVERVALSLVIVLAWLWVWKLAAERYFWRTVKRKPSSSQASPQ